MPPFPKRSEKPRTPAQHFREREVRTVRDVYALLQSGEVHPYGIVCMTLGSQHPKHHRVLAGKVMLKFPEIRPCDIADVIRHGPDELRQMAWDMLVARDDLPEWMFNWLYNFAPEPWKSMAKERL